MECKVSVIVPCYNVEAFLDRCMNSLLNQTLRDIEIILIDDESPDGVPFMCEEYTKKDKRVRTIHKKNGGLGYARNTGLDVAVGEYVAFVDSDDYLEQNALEKMYANAKISDADAVFSGFYTENVDGSWNKHVEFSCAELLQDKKLVDFKLGMIATPPYVKKERYYWVSVWHAIYSREVLQNYGIRFVSERDYAAEDLPFQVQFLNLANRIICLPDCFYHYCLNKSSLTHSYSIDKFFKLKKIGYLLKGMTQKDKEAELRINRFLISDARMHFLRMIQSDNKHKFVLMKQMMQDALWKDVSSYKPSYFPLYSRIFYFLVLKQQAYLLFCYAKVIVVLKKLFKKK